MNRNLIFATITAVAATMSALAAPTKAGLPAVLDRVPAEATVVLATRALDDVDRGVSQLIAAVELPALATPSELLRRVGLGEGIDMSKPMAIALMPGDLDGDMPPAVMFLPTKDFDGMMDMFGASADAGVHSFRIQTGETLYARMGQGGYATVGPIREIVTAVDGRAGNMKAHQAHLGGVGAGLCADSHAFVVLKRPMLDFLHMNIREEMEGTLQMAAMMGGADAEQMQAQAERAQEVLDAVFRDARDMVLGMTAGATGMTFDVAIDFEPDSELGGAFNSRGDSHKLLRALPNQPFMFAYSLDTTTPTMNKLLNAMMKLNMGGVDDGEIDFAPLLERVTGQSGAVYPSPGGLMGGLLANTVTYTTSGNVKAMMDGQREFFKKLDLGGLATMQYQQNVTQVDGVDVDGWSVSLDMAQQADPFAGAMVQQMTMMLFGPGGIGGYYAPGADGVFQTLSRNSQLLSAAMAAEKGQNSLIDDRAMSMVAQRLPANRSAEMYIGVHSIMQQVTQAMAMFGMPLEINLPQQLPPVGMGATTNDAAFRVTTFVPAPVIKVAGEAAAKAGDMMGGMGGPPRDPGGPPPF